MRANRSPSRASYQAPVAFVYHDDSSSIVTLNGESRESEPGRAQIEIRTPTVDVWPQIPPRQLGPRAPGVGYILERRGRSG